jgi:hypothetical protein
VRRTQSLRSTSGCGGEQGTRITSCSARGLSLSTTGTRRHEADFLHLEVRRPGVSHAAEAANNGGRRCGRWQRQVADPERQIEIQFRPASVAGPRCARRRIAGRRFSDGRLALGAAERRTRLRVAFAKYIATQLKMHKSTVIRSLRILRARGWITTARRGGRHRTNQYRIGFGRMDDDDAAS